MIDVDFEAGIKAIKLKVKTKDGVAARTCTMVLEREFDDLIAAGLGGDARKALLSLRDHGLESCVLPLDSVDAEGKLVAPDAKSISIGALKGVKATGQAGAKSEEPPSLLLEFEFVWNEQAWVFLGRYCGGVAQVSLKARQLTLAGTGGRRRLDA